MLHISSYHINQTNVLNINLFQLIIWSPDTTRKRGIEWAYLNPMIYLNTLNFNMGSPDNSLMSIGFNYHLLKSHKIYGQLLIDDFNLGNLAKSSGSYFQEKYAYQVGWKYLDALILTIYIYRPSSIAQGRMFMLTKIRRSIILI